jgi:DNA-directed RNA polymerase specialized sigma24 family protein
MRQFSSLAKKRLDLLTEDDWKDLWKRLRLYTYRNFGYKVRGRFNLDEVIQDAIGDAYSGRRRLPPEVNLIAFLCEVVRSKMSHLLKGEEKRISIEEKSVGSEPLDLTLENFLKQNLRLTRLGNESEQNIIYSELCGQIRRAVGSDTNLTELAELLFIKPDLRPREIAVELNKPVSTVYSMLKQLSKRARKSIEELSNG